MMLLTVELFGKFMLYGLLAITAIIVYYAIKLVIRARNVVRESGGYIESKPMKHFHVFLIMIATASVIIYLLKIGLENNVGMLNEVVFLIFPYLALAIFLMGSIYRYKSRGFQVSSLSSEFLERKKLFWGSQPFHWGLLVLFFGHLIAFLFPQSVLAWNGEPIRLLILEVSSFVFALAALTGLVLLIKRRMTNSQILVVSNKMDMLVYTTLLVQIVSGLGVAYFVRWGSSWFAGVLTPYLRSLFAFNPDIAAVSAMPWLIQIHIISAFGLIAIIPFTRYMHFLVAPIDYTWRGYQLVIWNWGRKSIRNSRAHFFGKKPTT
ncbi:MAG: respiratory nitrate reductase subunit gamma [Bacteroidetes bacterium]|nr:MAG: respiratory nitrate reductase subunit gamma [Bacteroidota bacterium]MBL1145772.1 respiratory nitrate reductase subunit gamma [Bacteroidota bacterium]NOG58566.1 respiratory nitrate reductase subunit gamma [Bacteroidota bacterium]